MFYICTFLLFRSLTQLFLFILLTFMYIVFVITLCRMYALRLRRKQINKTYVAVRVMLTMQTFNLKCKHTILLRIIKMFKNKRTSCILIHSYLKLTLTCDAETVSFVLLYSGTIMPILL